MTYVLYLDLFFLINLFMNVQILILVSVFLNVHGRILTIGVAAIIGSIWNCILILYPFSSEMVQWLVTIMGIGSVMNSIAFGIRSFKQILRANVWYLLSSACLGGGLTLLKEQILLNDWEMLICTGALTMGFGMLFHDFIASGTIGNQRFSVKLYYRGNVRTFTALADSGNRLRVPETQKPVALISYRDCKGFCEQVQGGFYIPYRAVGTDHGLLFAVTFEKMEILKNRTRIIIEHPAVAIVKESLSVDGDFNMILPEDYVTEISDCSSRRRKTHDH